MKTVNIDLGERSYEIVIAPELLELPDQVLPWIHNEQVFIVSDETVAPLYLDQVKQGLNVKLVEQIILPDGETTKSMQTLEIIFDRMMALSMDRSVTVIALGGGVIGDLTGFAAACYQRGVPFIQIPTTLLSQIDSSVGGKTGVNHPLGKNMIGAFYQPLRVIADTNTLKTLDPRQFSSGLAEVVKYGMIDDLKLFEWLESNIEFVVEQDNEALEYIIERSCIDKARIVEQDEREQGVRALLNLGHTFGHAIEAATGYVSWLHGEAVGLGLLMAADMSYQQGWLKQDDVDRVQNLLSRAGLPLAPSAEFTPRQLKSLMQRDKKNQHGNIRLVLLKALGEAFITSDYDDAILNQILKKYAIGSG